MRARVGVATGPGTSALHAIVISGEEAASLVTALLSKPAPSGSCYANILSSEGETIDDCICLRWPVAGEVSAEEMFLLSTHGSPLIQQQVLERCTELGANEWRGPIQLFTNGSTSDSQAVAEAVSSRVRLEALDRLPHAASAEICEFLLVQASGFGFAGEIGRWRDHSPEISRVERLLELSSLGLRLVEPPRVVLTGVTNAGKSTLFNALIGEDRSIVTAVEGTTRDLVTAHAQFSGWPCTLVDGAGIRSTSDEVEVEGLRRLQQELDRADLILELLSPGQSSLQEGRRDRTLTVFSRCDEWGGDTRAQATLDGICVSGLTGEGVADLENAIIQELHGGREIPLDEPCPFLSSHVIFLQEILQALRSGNDIEQCLNRFMEGAVDCHR